jgi:hypothetical protein
MGQANINLLQGTPDPLLFKAVGLGELHRLGISPRIKQITKGAFHVKPGLSDWAPQSYGRSRLAKRVLGGSEYHLRAEFYRLITVKINQIDAGTEQWERAALAMTNARKAN